MLTFASLFSGAGGFDLGLEAAGWQCKAQVEWNRWCQQVLQRHWPDVPKWGDVATVTGQAIGPVDAVVFGSPCQDLSVAGRRTGLEGSRSGLFHEAIRIIKEIQDATSGAFPRFIIWENVPGAFSSASGRDFAAVLDELANCGALDIGWRMLDSQWFGVPQRRKRVFVVADTAGRCAGALLPDPQPMQQRAEACGQERLEVAGTLTAHLGHCRKCAGEAAAGLLVVDGDKVRTLTPVETERLQGWPDDHTAFTADGRRILDSHRYRMAGNGVTAPVAKWIGQRILEAIKQETPQ